MKFRSFSRPIERRPEAPRLYADPLQVEAFRRESARGLVQLIERCFVDSTLRRVGEREILRVLDVGSGPGWIPMMLAGERPSWEIFAVDASHSMLRKAGEEARFRGIRVTRVQALAEEAPFPDSRFDLVVSHFAFSEFADPGAALHEMTRILDRRGWLIIQDVLRPPRWQFPILVLARYILKPFDRASRQYVDRLKGAYSESELAGFTRAAGLESARLSTFGGWRGKMWRFEAREAAYRSLLANGRHTAPDRRLPHSSPLQPPIHRAVSLAPEDGSTPAPDVVSSIVEAAHWAPTPDNWQAWRFHWTGECLEVYWDFETGTSSLDVDHCLAFMSIGGAVTNMEIAAAENDIALRVELASERRSNHPVARIFFEPASTQPSPLAAFIRHRCTNRRPYATSPPRPEVIERLCGASGGSTLIRLEMICDRRAVETISSLASDFCSFSLLHREIYDAVFGWVRWTQAEALRAVDGIPASALEPGRGERLTMRLLRHWPLARFLGGLGLRRYLARRARDRYSRSGAIGVLSLNEPSAHAAFEAGRIMEKVWLMSTLEGLALQPISGIPLLILRNRLKDGDGLPEALRGWAAEAEETIRFLAGLEEKRLPVLLFRVGEARPPSARAQRRPLASVFS